jgi:leader peptidase (prepilin peptidase) / N-methyltransferase
MIDELAMMPTGFALATALIALAALAQPWMWRRLATLFRRDRQAASAGLPLSQTKRLWPIIAVGAIILMAAIASAPAMAGRADAAMTLSLLAMASLCAMLCIVDWRAYWLPDSLVLALAAMGVVASIGMGAEPWVPLAGIIIGYGYMAATRWLFRVWRGLDGLGGGDVKLAGAMGAWLGPFDLPMALALASLLAIIAGLVLAMSTGHLRTLRIAFGPYLALSVMVFVSLRAAGGLA